MNFDWAFISNKRIEQLKTGSYEMFDIACTWCEKKIEGILWLNGDFAHPKCVKILIDVQIEVLEKIAVLFKDCGPKKQMAVQERIIDIVKEACGKQTVITYYEKFGKETLTELFNTKATALVKSTESIHPNIKELFIEDLLNLFRITDEVIPSLPPCHLCNENTEPNLWINYTPVHPKCLSTMLDAQQEVLEKIAIILNGRLPCMHEEAQKNMMDLVIKQCKDKNLTPIGYAEKNGTKALKEIFNTIDLNKVTKIPSSL